MIDLETQERIKAAVDIVDVLSEFLSLRRSGSNYKCLCPFHQEKTPSFVVSPARGIYHCFSCGVGGDAISFLMRHEQMSYPEALRWLANKYHIEIHERKLSEEEHEALSKRESLYNVNQWACEFFEHILHDTQEGQSIGMAYLRKRGFRDDTIRKFHIGLAPQERDALSKAANKAGYNVDLLLETGLSYKTKEGQMVDRFAGRVIFPVQALDGKIVAFGGRIMNTHDKNVGKYVNSPESSIYSKRNHLYGLFLAKKAIQKNDNCFLTEGYIDVTAMHQVGIENVVASSGTSLTYEQIRLIKRFTNNLTILYDGDAAGIKASLRGINMLLEEGMKIMCLLLPDGEDPDSYALHHGSEATVAYVKDHQVDFLRFKRGLLMKDAGEDPYKQGQAVNDILRSIAVIPDPVVRSYYIKECSDVTEVDEKTLINRTADFRREHYAEKKKQQERAEAREQLKGEANDSKATVLTNSQNGGRNIPNTPNVANKAETKKKSLIGVRETNLMRLCLRNASKKMKGEEFEGMTILQYILQELDSDDITIQTPVYRKMIDECRRHALDEDFDAGRWFVKHEDNEMVEAAANLLSDKYWLSDAYSSEWNVYEENKDMDKMAFLVIVDLKWAIVTTEMREILAELKSASGKDIDKNKDLLAEYNSLKEVQTELRSLINKYSH